MITKHGCKVSNLAHEASILHLEIVQLKKEVIRWQINEWQPIEGCLELVWHLCMKMVPLRVKMVELCNSIQEHRVDGMSREIVQGRKRVGLDIVS